jgi:hypothetical protein
VIPEKNMYPIFEIDYPKEKYLKSEQVPLITKKIDLVLFEISSREIIAIEMKVSNWKRALQQAIYYKLCADRTYVALWHEYIHRVNQRIFKEEGIGLLEVNGRITKKIDAKRSDLIQKSLKERIEEYMEVNKNVNG